MTKKITFQVNFSGGIVSPGALLQVLQQAKAARVEHVRFGLRQQLLIDVAETTATTFLDNCIKHNVSVHAKKDAPPNIASSYPACGLFTNNTWLSEDVFKDILHQIDYTPRFKINICDPTQNLVPLLTGHTNWVASSIPHFWHLYIRLPQSQTHFSLPQLIYTNEVGAISKLAETVLQEIKSMLEVDAETALQLLLLKIASSGNTLFGEQKAALQLPRFSLPYYEGFNQSASGLWLGLYRRDQLFPINFLIDVCTLCTESKIGELYATPWKSLIIKGIAQQDQEKWHHVLGKYRINVRHAANELAWQVEDGDEGGLTIKRTIIRHFDKEDVRTYGLSFGVQTKPTASMFGSIIIRKQQTKNPHRLRSLDRYDLLYTKDFNPNASELILFRDGVTKEQLGTYIVSLCKMYYQQEEEKFAQKTAGIKQVPKAAKAKPVVQEVLYQCKHCLTVYDAALGDENAGIAPNTPFTQLPDDYTCALCDSPKADFLQKANNSLQPELC